PVRPRSGCAARWAGRSGIPPRPAGPSYGWSALPPAPPANLVIPVCAVLAGRRPVPDRATVGTPGRTPVAVSALAPVAATPVARVARRRPVRAALTGRYLGAFRTYLVQVDLAALVDVGDLYLDLVADVEEVLDLLDPLAVTHLGDVQQPVPAGQQRDERAER